MTRFWISLPEAIAFVESSFARMQGGEIFVPKIPSVRITDLVEAMAPGKPIQIVGIRPGEKLHEIMCPADDSHLTLVFDDHYVIRPTICFVVQVDYATNAIGENGRQVAQGFEYSSGHNEHFLSVEELRRLDAAS